MSNDQANFRVQAHALTDKGRRPNNEDFVISFEPTDLLERQKSGCIYIVADGVGGASIGERASKYAAEKVLYEYLQYPETEPGKRLKQVITHVNREIFDYAQDKGIRMATTMTVAVVLNNSLIAANVGDSRLYLIRENEVSQVTNDHNIVGELVRNGEMTEAEALKSKSKNRLTRSVGGDEEVQVDIFGPIPLQPKDKILLCSDGLTRYALKEDIANLTVSDSPEEIAKGLVSFAKERGHGGADNISVITVTYEPSIALDVTIQHPRPKAPEQPLEKSETVYAPKLPKPKLRIGKWVAVSSMIFLGIILIGVIVIAIFAWQGNILMIGIKTPTNTVTMTSLPSVTPTLTLTVPSVTPGTASPLAVEYTTDTSLVTGTIDCSNINKSGVVRSLPSEQSANVGTLNCGENVILTGRYIPDNIDDKHWYRVSYDKDGESKLGWIYDQRVVVLQGDKENLQILNYEGTPIAPTTNLVNCIYVIKDGEYLSTIAEKFGISDWGSIKCDTLVSPECERFNQDSIKAGWNVIIPDIPADRCIAGGGNLPDGQ